MTDPIRSVNDKGGSLAPAVKGKADAIATLIATLIVTARAMRDAWTHATAIDARNHEFPGECRALDDAWSDLDDALHGMDDHAASVEAGPPPSASGLGAPEGLTDHEALARVLADHGCMDWDKLLTTNGGGELLDELYEQARVILAAGFRRSPQAAAEVQPRSASPHSAPEGKRDEHFSTDADDALDELVELIEANMEDAAGCVSAAQAIIEAGYRRPTQAGQGTSGQSVPPPTTSGSTP